MEYSRERIRDVTSRRRLDCTVGKPQMWVLEVATLFHLLSVFSEWDNWCVLDLHRVHTCI